MSNVIPAPSLHCQILFASAVILGCSALTREPSPPSSSHHCHPPLAAAKPLGCHLLSGLCEPLSAAARVCREKSECLAISKLIWGFL